MEYHMAEAAALLERISKFLKLEDNYWSVEVRTDPTGTYWYKAYLSYGDKLNTCLMWQYTTPEELLNELFHFLETADVNHVLVEYHKKQIESNKATIAAHTKRLKELGQ